MTFDYNLSVSNGSSSSFPNKEKTGKYKNKENNE